MNTDEFVQERLNKLLLELQKQTNLDHHFGGTSLSFAAEMEQIREYVQDAGEYGVAYESLVANLEQVPFVISGKAAVSLLEVGLIMGYKTDTERDAVFDRR